MMIHGPGMWMQLDECESSSCMIKRINFHSQPTRPHIRRGAAGQSAKADQFLISCRSSMALAWGGGARRLGARATRVGAQMRETTQTWQRPESEDLAKLADRPDAPSLSLDPQRKIVAWVYPGPPHPPIAELSRPERRLAGVRIDPEEFCRSRIGYSADIRFQMFDRSSGPHGTVSHVTGLPSNCRLNFISFSPNGMRFALAARSPGSERSPPTLYVADVANAVDGEGSSVHATMVEPALNALFENYLWIDDDTLLVSAVPEQSLKNGEPAAPAAAPGPTIQSNAQGEIAVNVTFQDLLESEHDCTLFEYFATSELRLARVNGGIETMSCSKPGMYTHVEVSPDSRYLLVDYFSSEGPFSYQVPAGRFPKRTEIWRSTDLSHVSTVEDSPLIEHIPSRKDATRPGRRGIQWRPDAPATLIWVYAEDEGDPDRDVTPRDTVLQLSADQVEAGQSAVQLTSTAMRFSGLFFGREDLALLYEGSNNARKTKCWRICPDIDVAAPELVFDRSMDDAYSSPGRPVSRRTSPYGTYLLATVRGIDGIEHMLWSGIGATPEGQRPFLSLRPTQQLSEPKQVWRLKPDATRFESPGLLLSRPEEVSPLDINGLQFLSSRESPSENPQLSIFTLADAAHHSNDEEACDSFAVSRKQISDFPHPHPHVEPQKHILFYEREDGCQLNGALFAPKEHSYERDGPLPTVVWAYPRDFRSKSDAGQLNDSQQKFEPIPALSVLSLVTLGYAVLEGPAMPIIAESIDEEPNDTYVQQLTSSARAAVDTLVERGFAPRDRIACGGALYVISYILF